MVHSRVQTALAAVFAALLVVNAAGVGVAVPESSQGTATAGVAEQEEQAAGNETAEVADEVYVTEDGDVVLVYNENNTESSTARGHLGANLSEGLFHLFLNDTVDDMEGMNTTGNASLSLTPDELAGSGELLTDKPESIEDMSFTASGVTSTEESHASMMLDASFVNPDTESTSFLDTRSAQSGPTGSLETEGYITTTGTQFKSEGSVTLSAEDSTMPAQEMAFAVTLTEDSGDYTLDISRENRVNDLMAERWSSEESARETIRAQFGLVAQQLGGEVSVDIASYSFDSETNRLDIEYSVTFTGVEDAVAQQLSTMLAESAEVDLSDSEAQELAEQIQEMTITELSGALDVSGDEVAAEWTVQIDNYDEAAMAALEIADSVDPMDIEDEEIEDEEVAAEVESAQQDFEESLAQARAQFEARQESNLTQTLRWNGSVAADEKRVDVRMTAEQETENWQAYVSEVQERENVSLGGDTEFDIQAHTQDGNIVANGSFTLSQEGMINQSIDSLQQQTAGTSEFTDQAPVQAFQRADFETARMDMSLENETVTVEAGASFENATEFRSLLDGMYGETGEFQSLYAQPEDGRSLTYVRVDNALSEDPSESAVRELATVDEQTTVYLPDEWDQEETEFPEMDTAEVRSYLELDEDTNEGSMEIMLPVAVGGAALVLAGGAVVGLRRL